ncbi:MAG: VTT domain-containing protein [Candidatus Paceibacterota bacterium]
MERIHHTLTNIKNRGSIWFMQHAESRASDVWLAVLSFLETIVFPIPIDPYLMALIVVRTREWFYLALLTTGASVLGAFAGYFIGVFFFDVVGARIIALYGLEEGFSQVQQGFAENTFWLILTGAFTPLPFKLFVLTGGFLKVNLFAFLAATILGRGVRYIAFAYITKLFGPKVAQLVGRYFTIATLVAVVFIAIAIALYVSL